MSTKPTEKEKAYMNDRFFAFLDEVYKLEDANGHEFAYAFHALPLRANLEYYRVIKHPMSYSKIRLAAKHKRYEHPQAFIRDLVQISWNARFFNEESSDFNKFGVILNNFIVEKIIPSLKKDSKIYRREMIGYPNVGLLPGETSPTEAERINAKLQEQFPPPKPKPQQQPKKPQQQQQHQEQQHQTQQFQLVQPEYQQQQQQQQQPQQFTQFVQEQPAPVPVSAPATVTAPSSQLSNTPMSATQTPAPEDVAPQVLPQEQQQGQNLVQVQVQVQGQNQDLHHNSALEDERKQNYIHNTGMTQEQISQRQAEDEARLILNQPYNPSSYHPKIEDTGIPHVYFPPTHLMSQPANRHILEQWVKRGRPPVVDKPHEMRIKSIMRGLKKIKVAGKTMVSFWDKLPSQGEHPDYLKLVKDPICMLEIKALIKQRFYNTVDAYVADVFRLINNNRAYFTNDEFIKNNLNVLETNVSRLYQIEMAKPDIEYMTGQHTNRFPLNQVMYDGRVYKVGSWVLLRNPNDEARPTIAQIFRLWQQEDGELCMNVCWYYRPEWTVHRVDRLFLENEVVKSGQYRDHYVSEILQPCYVAYFTRWLKGDPAIDYEGPLFVCEFRYNEKECTFAKIRTWRACLPDEIRHIEDPIKPLTAPRVLRKYPSPIKGLLLPGSTSSSPIPPPMIVNMNSPPIVGAVYVPRDDDENDLHYFDSSVGITQCKVFIPPQITTTNIATSNTRIVGVDYHHNHHLHDRTATPDYDGHGRGSATNGSASVGAGAGTGASAVASPGVGVSDVVPGTGMLNLQSGHAANAYNPNNVAFKAYNASKMNQYAMNASAAIANSILANNAIANGNHKVIKTPYNTSSYAFSQYHSPSSSFAFVRSMESGGLEDSLIPLVKNSYTSIDRHNYERVGRIYKQQATTAAASSSTSLSASAYDTSMNGDVGSGIGANSNGNAGADRVEKGAIVWFRGPPVNVVDRVLADDVFDNVIDNDEGNNGAGSGSLAFGKRVRCGHSVEYLAWKLKQKKRRVM